MHSVATGVRLFGGDLHRQEGGPGSTSTDFDMSLVGGPYETDMKFCNFNGAAFAENEFRISSRLTVTPGARVEFLHSVSYTHLRAHETDSYLVCRLLLEKKKTK